MAVGDEVIRDRVEQPVLGDRTKQLEEYAADIELRFLSAHYRNLCPSEDVNSFRVESITGHVGLGGGRRLYRDEK